MAQQQQLDNCLCGSVRVGAGWCQSVRTHGTHLPLPLGRWLCEVCGWKNRAQNIMCWSCGSQQET